MRSEVGFYAQAVIIVLGAVALWWFKFASDELKATTEETMAPIMGSLRSSGEWLVEAVMRLKEKATGGASLGLHAMHVHFSLISDRNLKWSVCSLVSPQASSGVIPLRVTHGIQCRCPSGVWRL